MCSNISGNAYALTLLCPIRPGLEGTTAYVDVIRDRLEAWNQLPLSPMAQVPNTYLCRYYVLDDVFKQSLPGGGIWDTITDLLPVPSKKTRVAALPHQDRLKSRYLVFSSNFHGDLDTYLHGMWHAVSTDVQSVWKYCYGFESVSDAPSFAAYAKRCQLDAALFFVGSNDDPLQDQLKALYVKQEFSRFAQETQDLAPAQLREAYRAFMLRVKPRDTSGPAWTPGMTTENPRATA